MFSLFGFVQWVEAQSVNCAELIHSVEQEGHRREFIGPVSLVNSHWLYSVALYELDGSYAVIAVIKQGFIGRKYVFCDISKSRWTAFRSGLNDLGTTFGERFQQYIMECRCDCS
ncbi:hypothetical protein [Pontibacter sp. G13]|uniref:hypothetical protein n=1 Tax=Pontibacter sp. G13 TaxID=3074898 RepID=UPI00288B3F14|nr:hypothetical protein [Pontibacter sp. G13]WNJ18620.1 hypothetical protein RJD25_27505 [Pontibacter sp. G13]